MYSNSRRGGHELEETMTLKDWKARGAAVNSNGIHSLDALMRSSWGKEFIAQINHVPTQWEVEKWRLTGRSLVTCTICTELNKSLCIAAEGDQTGIIGCKRCKRESLPCSFRADFFAWFVGETMGVSKQQYQQYTIYLEKQSQDSANEYPTPLSTPTGKTESFSQIGDDNVFDPDIQIVRVTRSGKKRIRTTDQSTKESPIRHKRRKRAPTASSAQQPSSSSVVFSSAFTPGNYFVSITDKNEIRLDTPFVQADRAPVSSLLQFMEVVKEQEEVFQAVQRREQKMHTLNESLQTELTAKEAEIAQLKVAWTDQEELIQLAQGEISRLALKSKEKDEVAKENAGVVDALTADLVMKESRIRTLEKELAMAQQDVKATAKMAAVASGLTADGERLRKVLEEEKAEMIAQIKRLAEEVPVPASVTPSAPNRENHQAHVDREIAKLQNELKGAAQKEKDATEKMQQLMEENQILQKKLGKSKATSILPSSEPLANPTHISDITAYSLSADRQNIHFEPPFVWTFRPNPMAVKPCPINSLQDFIDVLNEQDALNQGLLSMRYDMEAKIRELETRDMMSRNPWDQLPHLLPLASCVARFRQWAEVLEEPALKGLLGELEMIQMNMLSCSGSALYPPTEFEAKKMEELLKRKEGGERRA